MNGRSICANPVTIIGYESAALAKHIFAEGTTVRQVAYEEVVGGGGVGDGQTEDVSGKIITKEAIDSYLDPWSMTLPGGGGECGGEICQRGQQRKTMGSKPLKYFMWEWQHVFRAMLSLHVERVFRSLHPDLQAECFLVGVRHQSPNEPEVLIEPDDFELTEGILLAPAHLAAVPMLALALEASDPDRNVAYGDRRSNEQLPERIRRKSLAGAVEKVLNEDRWSDEYKYFPLLSAEINGTLVCPVIRIPRRALSSIYSLQRPIVDGMSAPTSLLDAVATELRAEVADAFSVVDPGSLLSRRYRPEDEVLRSAAVSLMQRVAFAGGEITDRLFETCDIVATLPYEGRKAQGRLVVARREHPACSVDVVLAKPLLLDHQRAVRKLLEVCSDRGALLSDGRVVYGLGDVRPTYSGIEEDLFEVRFNGNHRWDLWHAAHRMLNVRYGRPSLPHRPPHETLFRSVAERCLGGATKRDIEALWDLIQAAATQQHGTMLVISVNASTERVRLGRQCFSIEPQRLSPELLKRLSAVDGALLLRIDGTCEAFGVILDGVAVADEGDRARGARYNSAVRYLSDQQTGCLIVVVSEDGSIDILPVLQPRIPRSTVQAALARLEELQNEDAELGPRLASTIIERVEQLAFYLTPEQCQRANEIIHSWEERRMAEDGLKVVRRPLEPHPSMNDSFFAD